MRHLCPIVGHRTPPVTLRKCAGKSEMPAQNPKNGRKLPVRCLGEPAICPAIARGKSPSGAPGPSAHFGAFSGRPRRSRRESQRSRGSRPLSTRCSAAPQIPPAFSDPAPAPAGDVPNGTFLSHERTRFRQSEPEKPWRTSPRPLRLCGSTTLRIPRPDQPVARRVASAAILLNCSSAEGWGSPQRRTER